MSERERPTAPDLERVHQSRGLSWKVAGVVGVAVLVGLAGLRLLDTNEQTAPRPVAAAPASSPRATAHRDPVQPTLTPTTPPVPVAVGTPMPWIEPPPEDSIRDMSFGEDKFALVARIDDRLYMDVLREELPGRFTGAFRLPFPSNAQDTYQFDFVQLWTRDDTVRNYYEIGTWDVALTALREGTDQADIVLSDFSEPRARARAVPRPVRRGYTIVVSAESRYRYGVINTVVVFGDTGTGAIR